MMGQGELLGFDLGHVQRPAAPHALEDNELCHCELCEEHRQYLAELEFLERQSDLFR